MENIDKNIEKLSSEELNHSIKLCEILIKKYENMLMGYGGIVNNNEPYIMKAKNSFNTCSSIYNVLLEHAEKRLLSLLNDNENVYAKILNESVDKTNDTEEIKDEIINKEKPVKKNVKKTKKNKE